MLNVTTVRDEVHTENLLVVGVDVSKDKFGRMRSSQNHRCLNERSE